MLCVNSLKWYIDYGEIVHVLKAVTILTSKHLHVNLSMISPEWGLNLGLGSQKKCPFPQNRGVLSIGVTNTVYPLLMDISLLWTVRLVP